MLPIFNDRIFKNRSFSTSRPSLMSTFFVEFANTYFIKYYCNADFFVLYCMADIKNDAIKRILKKALN